MKDLPTFELTAYGRHWHVALHPWVGARPGGASHAWRATSGSIFVEVDFRPRELRRRLRARLIEEIGKQVHVALP